MLVPHARYGLAICCWLLLAITDAANEATDLSSANDHENNNNHNDLPPFYVYVHVPKCGGAFMRQFLRTGFASKKELMFSYGLGGKQTFLSFDQETQSSFSAVHGHFGYGIHQASGWKLDGLRQPVYLTMLRDPVDRLLSQFPF